jgi:hypothetical protein
MTRGVALYFVGSIVLVSLAGCGRGWFRAEREPWRAEAEIACLRSGAVKESADIVRIEPINGPGMCGADYPLKVTALGESVTSSGFTDEDLRPPASIGRELRWPLSQPPSAYPQGSDPPGAPISLSAPGIRSHDAINLPVEGTPSAGSPYTNAPPSPPPNSPPRLGPLQSDIGPVGLVAMRPPATLACPIVSALDRWLADSVQPAAQRWFHTRIVEIKQISAYSCRAMNGNPHAHISEHAFGNALDIAAFTLADGRRVTVKDGWRGLPEEQGFLRDIQATACKQFATVLAPGSNVYHSDHIHIDLMRRASRRVICEPDAVSGEEIAARIFHRNPYASSPDPHITGSLSGHGKANREKAQQRGNEEDELADE